MRKIALFATCVAMLGLFAACSEKEGAYTPKKQISKVYKASTTINSEFDEETQTWTNDTNITPKTLSETWAWDGKKLKSITIGGGSEEELDDVITFTYDGKQITRMDTPESRMEFTYDGSELTEAKVYSYEEEEEEEAKAEKLSATIAFEHKSGKIAHATITGDGDFMDFKKSGSQMQRMALRALIPSAQFADRVAELVSATAAKGGSKAETTINVDFEWNGDNVSNLKLDCNGISIKMGFAYDNKNNPYQHNIYAVSAMLEGGSNPMCANNVTRADMDINFIFMQQNEVINYTYTYDGNWPTSQTAITEDTSDGDGDSQHRSIDQTTTYYEYVK